VTAAGFSGTREAFSVAGADGSRSTYSLALIGDYIENESLEVPSRALIEGKEDFDLNLEDVRVVLPRNPHLLVDIHHDLTGFFFLFVYRASLKEVYLRGRNRATETEKRLQKKASVFQNSSVDEAALVLNIKNKVCVLDMS
jgi:hypothetical protein